MATSLPLQTAHVVDFPGRSTCPEGSVRLSVAFQAAWPICTLTLSGWLDCESSVALHAQFDQVAWGSFAEVVLDIGGLTRLDAAGNAALDSLQRLIRTHGGRVRIMGSIPLAPHRD
ncbi:MAG: STAS domain-containing protein [Acidimicrobiales bacterium]|nr:STAS domain-containing protein [Acidimicrobiales bacterium]